MFSLKLMEYRIENKEESRGKEEPGGSISLLILVILK